MDDAAVMVDCFVVDDAILLDDEFKVPIQAELPLGVLKNCWYQLLTLRAHSWYLML